MPAESELAGRPQLPEPVFEGLLVRRLNGAKTNSHSRRSHVGNRTQSNEGRAAVVDADAHFRSMRKRRRRLDKAAENAQIARDRQNLPFRFDIDDFGFGRERAPHGAMLFHPHNQSMNLFGGQPPRQIGAGVSFFTCMPLPGLLRLFRSLLRFRVGAYSKPPFSIKRWADWSRTLPAPILVRRKPSHNKKKEKTCKKTLLRNSISRNYEIPTTRRSRFPRPCQRWPRLLLRAVCVRLSNIIWN